MDSKNLKQFLNKIPEITIYFWIIKILCTTVGETGADYLTYDMHWGLFPTTVFTSILLAVALLFQFRAKKYVAGIYWLAIVLISIVGTLITDNLTDYLKVPLEITTTVFGLALAGVFAIWYAVEKTLSIHTIYTVRREAFYWLAILLTFAVGTAAGDLFAERLELGYRLSAIIFAVLIVMVASTYYIFKANSVLTFWIAYILTRPQGASIADYLIHSKRHGGLGLGTVPVNGFFFFMIIGLVTYLAITKKDALK